MNRSFLASLGLEKAVIDQIMDENGKDIETAKGKKTDFENRIAELTTQLGDRDKQLESIKKSSGDVESLKTKIAALQEENAAKMAEADKRYKDLQVETVLDKALSEAGVKSAKAVKAFLELNDSELKDGQIKGLAEQLEALKASEETSFLFNNVASEPTEPTPPVIKGVVVQNGLSQPPEDNSYQSRWRKAIESHDTITAVAIKNKAAAEGVYF